MRNSASSRSVLTPPRRCMRSMAATTEYCRAAALAGRPPLRGRRGGATHWGRGTARPPVVPGRSPGTAVPESLDQSEAVESGCVSGSVGERSAELPLRARGRLPRRKAFPGAVPSRPPILRKLQARRGSQPHGGDRAAGLAEQFSRVRDAGIGRKARLEPRQLVQGANASWYRPSSTSASPIAATAPPVGDELGAGAPGEYERPPKRWREGASDARPRTPRRSRPSQLERPAQHCFGSRVVASSRALRRSVVGLAEAVLDEPASRGRSGGRDPRTVATRRPRPPTPPERGVAMTPPLPCEGPYGFCCPFELAKPSAGSLLVRERAGRFATSPR